MAILRNVLSSTTNTNIAKIIRGSTRLDTNRTSYFDRTPSSAGNRRKWTISVWIKNTNNYEESVGHTSNYTINAAGTWSSGNQIDGWDISTSEGTHNVKDSLHWSGGVYGVSTQYNYGSYQSCRDVSGWYNFVIHVDTGNSASASRCRTWTNGVENELKLSGSYPTITQYRDMMWNNNSPQYLFNDGPSSTSYGYMDGYACEMHHIDGCLVDVSNFGFIDPETGVWKPKKYTFGKDFPNNRGDIWSSVLTAPVSGFTAAAPAFNCFDGDATNSSLAGTNNATGANILFTPAATIAGVTKLRVYMDHSTSYRTRVNGGSWATDSTLTSGGNASWRDLTSLLGGTDVTSIESDTDGANNGVNWSAIEINDTILLDGEGYGTNGFYLPLDGTGSAAFQDSSNYGEDQSGRGNDWTKNGTMYFTCDSPSGGALSVNNNAGITTTNFPSNYCVWDATSCGNEPPSTLGDGATKFAYNSAGWRKIRGTIPMKAGGKYYFEMRTDTSGSIVQGICNSDCDFTDSGQHASQSNYGGYGVYNNGTAGDAEIVNYSASTSSVWAVADNEILGVALDLSAGTTTGGKLYFYKNGTMLNSAAAWPGGPGQDIDCTRDWWPAVSAYNTGSGGFHSFFGATPFNYMPPDGFLPVCSSNYQPSFSTPPQHVGIVTYTGSGSSQQIGMDFRTDMVWIKSRGNTYNWRVFDSVRGMKGETSKALYLDTSDVEAANNSGGSNNDGALTANPGGFNISTSGDRINESSDTLVSYSWKAGGNENTFNIDGTGFSTFAATGITAGTITPTGMSIGKDSGFGVVQYTGNDTAGATVPHGLGAKPAFMIIKCVNNGDDWLVYHKSEGATKYGYMNGTGAFGTATTAFNDTEPTDNVFSLGTSADGNSSSYNYIAYVWAEKPGLNCFTRYKGNGQVLGPEIPMDFLPALTIVKNSSNGSEWSVIDRVRNAYNLADTWISTSSAAGDASPGYYRDLNSNGMKIRDNGSGVNTDNQDYIVMAWALHPINATQGSQSTGG